MAHLLTETQKKVTDFKKPGYLVGTVDRVAPKHHVTELASAEVTELIEALNVNNELEIPREFADILVFYFSWIAAHAPQMRADDNLTGVNGFGRHSNALEKLQETILDSADDPRAVTETVRRIWSIVIWNPFALEGLRQMDSVILKVQSNYPPELFTDFDPTLRRISTPEEVIARYHHLKALLRLLRKDVQRTLVPQDWLPHVALMRDWQHSREAHQELQKILNQGKAL